MHRSSHLDHTYDVDLRWTGNRGVGTAGYTSYDRAHELQAAGRPVLQGSSDPAFRGDASRYNPEELLVGALSACHMLTYLHLCSDAGLVVTEYTDAAHGSMTQTPDGGGQFTEVLLRPVVTLSLSDTADEQRAFRLATTLHERAHDLCFIARSVNFPVRCEPRLRRE